MIFLTTCRFGAPDLSLGRIGWANCLPIEFTRWLAVLSVAASRTELRLSRARSAMASNSAACA